MGLCLSGSEIHFLYTKNNEASCLHLSVSMLPSQDLHLVLSRGLSSPASHHSILTSFIP